MFRNPSEQKMWNYFDEFFSPSETPYYKMKFKNKVRQKKETPDNTGKQYFKWTCETRTMLLE